MRSLFLSLPAGALAAALSVGSSFAGATVGLQAYAFSDGGQSTNPTTGPTDYMRYNYPGGQSGKYYSFTPGPGYNVIESTQYVSGATGPLTASSSVSAGGMGPQQTGTYAGSSQSYAAFGHLGVAATGTYAGLTDPSAVRGSEAFATYTESITIPGASGQYGYFVPTFTVDGAWSKTGSAATQLELDYNVNGGPTFLAYRIQGDSADAPSLWNNGYVSSIPGLTVTPTSVTGTALVTLPPILFNYNLSFELTIALYAGVIPYSNGSGTVDFLHTATLSGIAVLDALRNPLTDFTIQSGSGTVYTAAGVQTVPVPASAWLFGSGVLALGAFMRRRASTQ